MSQLKNILTICTSLLLCMTCVSKDEKDTPLITLFTAMRTVDHHPQEALELLDEISFPEFLDRDSYQHYVVTLSQAQYMDYQDITNDSSILKVQRYFVENNNHRMATRASFYAAHYCREKQQKDKALEYFLLANHYAQLADNNLFRAKATNWVGSIYYNQEVFDKARDYYLLALEAYNQVNAEHSRLDLIYMLGRTYRELHQFDQALSYFNEGLEAAQKLNNQLYEARFMHYKGLLLIREKNYPQAKASFDFALAKKPNSEDSLRIYLGYARLYRMSNQPDSTIHYLELVKDRVAEITYPYTREAIYQELANYYEKEGYIPEMKHYLTLEKKEEQLIQNMKDEANSQAANERFEAYKTINRTKARSNRKILIGYLSGTASTANDAAFFVKKGVTEECELAGKKFRKLGERFIGQVADSVKALFEMSPKGVNALTEFTDEELCLTYLSWLEYPDNEIEWMIGHSDIQQRTTALRNKLNKFGLKEQDLKAMFA